MEPPITTPEETQPLPGQDGQSTSGCLRPSTHSRSPNHSCLPSFYQTARYLATPLAHSQTFFRAPSSTFLTFLSVPLPTLPNYFHPTFFSSLPTSTSIILFHHYQHRHQSFFFIIITSIGIILHQLVPKDTCTPGCAGAWPGHNR